MIDLKAARSEPERFREALARKGAAETFDRLLEADRAWLEPCRRSTSCAGGRSSRASRPRSGFESFARSRRSCVPPRRRSLRRKRSGTASSLRVPNLPSDDTPSARPRPSSRVRRTGDRLERGHASTWTSAASTWTGPRGCQAPSSAIGSAAAACTGALPLRARPPRREGLRVICPVLVREQALIGTAFPSVKRTSTRFPGRPPGGHGRGPLASLRAGEILDADELPLRYVAFPNPCFRH